MSDATSTGFAQFVPGFDFLQNLAKSSAQAMPHMPNMGSWMAPTLSVEELDKRISELKTVHFWLDQNAKALAATVQALEVQKMTLATLKSMNLNLADLANTFKPKPADTAADAPPQASTRAAAPTAAQAPAPGDQPAPKPSVAPSAGLSDPMQLWSALTHQFQTIAASALADMGKASAKHTAQTPAKSVAKAAAQTGAAARQAPAKKTPAKRAAASASVKTPAQNTEPLAGAPKRGLRKR